MTILSKSVVIVLFIILLLITKFSDGSVYYVTPTQSDANCPPGFPCHSLDYYASKSWWLHNGTDVSLLFLNGDHYLTEPLSSCVNNLQSFEMAPANLVSQDTHVVVHLLCENKTTVSCVCQPMLTVAHIEKLVIEHLEIRGKGKLLLFSETTNVHNVHFWESWLHIQISADVQSHNITVTSSTFENTKLAIIGMTRYSHSIVTVEDVKFLHGPTVSGGLLIICGSGLSLTINAITVGETNNHSSVSMFEEMHFVVCDEKELDSDVYISPYVDDSNRTISVANSILSDGHGIGIYFSIQPFDIRRLEVHVMIRNCSISGYQQGAIVWNSSLYELPGIASYTADLIIMDCFIHNNSHFTDALYDPHVAGLSVNRNHQGTVFLSNSIFQLNKDLSNAESIVWINHVENFTIRNCQFLDNIGRAVSAYDSNIFLSGNTSFIGNNVKYGSGGALYLDSSGIELMEPHNVMTVEFFENSAQIGGAIFVYDPLASFYHANNPRTSIQCFYQLNTSGPYRAILNFVNNTAEHGGDHIYGAALQSYCLTYAHRVDHPKFHSIGLYKELFMFYPTLNSSFSGISSVPTRVCVCGANEDPQCSDMSKIFVTDITVCPGEMFMIPVVLVGADFGTSTGTVYAHLFNSEDSALEEQFRVQNIQHVNKCTKLQYKIQASPGNVSLYLLPSDSRIVQRDNTEQEMNSSINNYINTGVPPIDLQTTPVYIKVSLVPCPAGFKLNGNPPTCECNLVKQLKLSCEIENGRGYINRGGMMWINSYHEDGQTGVIYNKNCPPTICNSSTIMVDLETDPDAQCAFNHAGTLCGGCKENYSLAIGSSHCIYCPNNNNLSLIILFSAAGFLLVILIGVLNLTITAGLVNGIIFYANILWTNQSLLFPPASDNGIQFLKTFIAWVNLDFGLETCFYQGMNAYEKSWLQFVFPCYLWIISGAIIVCCHYSTRMTNLIGNRAVPILATLLCLSYVKLMQTIVDGLSFAILNIDCPETSTRIIVWSTDGNLRYGHFPHIFLLIAVLVALLVLWTPYTAAMIFTQWLRRFSNNCRMLRWTVTLKPFLDAHYACLKDKHQYWYGVLLFVRGVHLVVFALTSLNAPMINLLSFSLSATLLLVYETALRVYKSKSVRLFNGACLLNLTILGASVIYTNLVEGDKSVAIILSVSVVFIQFCMLILGNTVMAVRCFIQKIWPEQFRDISEHQSLVHEDECNIANYDYHDSILESSVKDTY